ncbi:hypothetical protein AKJ09_03474 [Labilithrix luteola]|uniref:Sulfatase-modifying factor enzyme-like domain-containing protein n=1 Tax=Labilithrix luteola TaxID=1391654 RepID=A0A0K1PTF7_9BACT|nr:SUMF1/EgtB/PvdO family nonheme iron enzyme [Labilithrix luteola]AKU96810.1 hypothetical protein AKJ09_03474 [Labilithrix luteola]
MRPAVKVVTAAALVVAVLGGLRLVSTRLSPGEKPCGPGFHRAGPRCCAVASTMADGLCPVGPVAECPAPLVATARGCDAPDSVVDVPAVKVLIGPSDWEAEGRVKPRIVEAGPLRMDRFEVSVGHAFCPTCPLPRPAIFEKVDPARAASDVSRAEARAYCKAKGGRLPTEDEWIVAAAGDKPRRYPWGDTGAVCRRGAWGLTTGPCGTGAVGPDTVGAHADGATPSGIHDLAGNVAEWVESEKDARTAVVRGGAYDSALATDLRTWRRSEVAEDIRSPSIGFRCAYDVAVR